MMKSAGLIVVKILALTVLLFACFVVASPIAAPPGATQTPEEAGQAAVALLAVCFLTAIVVTHLILRSAWSGWRLMAAVFVVFYGVMTFMSQLESAVFITRLPPGMVPRLFLMGLVMAAPYAVFSVLILGKWKPDASGTASSTRLVMPPGEWAWKLAVVAMVYVTLYFTFGHFIAWQNPDVRAYYNGVDAGGFFAQMQTAMGERPWLVPFQLLRALLWVAFALPVIRMMKGSWQETALALGFLFAVPITQLLIPNPYMPESVRMSHLLETATSNFIFGCFVGWLLMRRFVVSQVGMAEESTA